jgi:uncharacterized protein (DUF169 family)
VTDYQSLERQFVTATGIRRRPVAVTFASAPAPEVPTFSGSVPSGCSFWRLASEGRVFQTAARDHRNCPIGAYTHNLPAEGSELMDTLGMMAGLGYIRMEEVPSVLKLPRSPSTVIYAPLGDTPVDPDAVVFAGRPGGLMLLIEASHRAGVASTLPLLPRPTCMAIPASLAHGVVASAGCIGNRTYTEIGDDELYVVARGRDLERLAAELKVIASANASLAGYHAFRRTSLAGE